MGVAGEDIKTVYVKTAEECARTVLEEHAPRQMSVKAFGCTQQKWTNVIWKSMDSSGQILRRRLDYVKEVNF